MKPSEWIERNRKREWNPTSDLRELTKSIIAYLDEEHERREQPAMAEPELPYEK